MVLTNSGRRWAPLLVAMCLAGGCRRGDESSGPPATVTEAMNRGVSFMGQYQYDPAAQAFEQALKANPALLDARINLANALFNRNGKEDLQRAEALLDEVLQKEPDNPRALYFKAIVLQHAGKAEQAVPLLEKVVKQRPEDGAAWYLLGLCLRRTGQPAEEAFGRAIQYRPYLYSAYYQLYQAAMQGSQEEKAKEYLDQFKKLRESPLGESIELPQYNQMGELALVNPLPAQRAPPVSRSRYSIKGAKTLFAWSNAGAASPTAGSTVLGGAAVGDLNGDGLLDLIIPLGSPGRLLLLRQTDRHEFVDATKASGLDEITNAVSCSLGDFDNDDVLDVFVAGPGGNHLFKGKGDGTFKEVTAETGLAGAFSSRSGLFLDADHDGDLDLFVCNAGANQLWNNNGDLTFTNLASQQAIACSDSRSVLVLPGDLDNDRDADLVVLHEGQPARVFLNQLLGQYTEVDLHGLDIRGDAGGALQDFDGDGILDLLMLGGEPRELKLFTGDGRGLFKPNDAFNGVAKAVASWGALGGFRTVDIDLDGDLDLVVAGEQLHLLLNDGRGQFVLQDQLWRPAPGNRIAAVECLDLNGDLVPDLMVVELGTSNRVMFAAGELSPPSTAVALQPNGIRGRDGRTRSPASGYGTRFLARAGLREASRFYTGQSGGADQSAVPVVLGLGGAAKADYVNLSWPDGVAQTEIGLAAGQVHKIGELQRKVSSCPVLFAWDGARFGFITDFAGVGGLGYFATPGVYAPPQVLEHVKIGADQLRPRNGAYELRVTEPMEEAAYVDQLELVAIDHATNVMVFPDERLAINGPPPTHQWLVIDRPLFPEHALDPARRECADRLMAVDRRYAYEPVLDRRYIGFCKPHALELDFGTALAELAGQDRVFLFINGFIEYPYSQTVYAARQSRVGWEPIRVERQEADGQWTTLVPDGGAPGGMGRMMTIDLSRQIMATTRKLRLTTNLEVFYDQIFVARDAGLGGVATHAVPLLEASLSYVGFAHEYSPDGRLPLIYDYDLRDATAPFHVLRGAYTRYGPVKELLTSFDDKYVIVGPGDEIAMRFDASRLAAPAPGCQRSFVLVSHAYCKDMDLYTATPRTLTPLPFRAMSRYPYPAGEKYPTSPEHQAFLREYNTRLAE
jgi:hypothetical protein